MYISELRNFRLLPEYENDLSVSMRREGRWLLVKTYSRNAGSHGRFFVDLEKLFAWMDNQDILEYWDTDCGNILRITWDKRKYVFDLDFWWLSTWTNGKLTGFSQHMEMAAYDFSQAIVRDEWQKILVKSGSMGEPVKFVWTESANEVLREVRKNKQVRRALCKAFAKGALSWSGSKITMYSDFAPYSFFFREDKGICGGLILHEGTHGSVRYSVHT